MFVPGTRYQVPTCFSHSTLVSRETFYHFVVFNCLLLINTAMNQRFITCLLAIFVGSDSFAPQAAGRQKTQRYFGLPSFGSKEDKNKADTVPKEKIGLKGLVQLITAGAGSPFLGDYEGTDPETGKMYFSLEANNLVDEVCHIILISYRDFLRSFKTY